MTDLIRHRKNGKHADRVARKALATELAAFNSSADLVELSAILDRHENTAEAADVRKLVDWHRAA